MQLFRRKMVPAYIPQMKIKRVIRVIVCIIFIIIVEHFGLFAYLRVIDFNEEFSYPLEGNISLYVRQLKNKQIPDVLPINVYNYSFISTCSEKCKSEQTLRLVYVVKSAMKNFDKRQAIRNSWGFERRFSDVPIRTVFVLGISDDDGLQLQISEEQQKYKDIVQADFFDTYFNNTIKTMMSFNWVMKFCSNSKFYMFSDDDMYISTKNVLRFVRNPTHYPQYLQSPVVSLNRAKRKDNSIQAHQNYKTIIETRNRVLESIRGNRMLQQVLDFELPDDVKLFTGYVFISSPLRFRSSKWYVSISEYPYNMWPPYVTAGAYVLSRAALEDMYYVSLYTKHFRFDDIYLGLVALKADIEPYHCPEFYFYKKPYNTISDYQYVIASHGYSNPNELLEVWNMQKSAGNA